MKSIISVNNKFMELTPKKLIEVIIGSKHTKGLEVCVDYYSDKEMMESIPIDRHDIEISYLTGIIDKKSINSKEINELSNCYVKIGNDLNINPSEIDKYLWEVGNTF